MTSDNSRLPGERPPNPSKLKLRYGDSAAEYADVREATARGLGGRARAEEWERVEEQLRSDDA